jgi:hypothetical protein
MRAVRLPPRHEKWSEPVNYVMAKGEFEAIRTSIQRGRPNAIRGGRCQMPSRPERVRSA